MTTRSIRRAALAAITLSFVPTTGAAQFPPDSLTNLKVFPKDIEVRALIGQMRGFALGLGVRCEFCHVGEPNQPLSTFDFADDEKETKLKAREMLRMVGHINEEHLPEVPNRSDPPIEVTCETCHHGISKPRTLQAVLLEAHAEGGLDSAIQNYRELRERYYGSAAYNFDDFVLTDVAEQLGAMGHLADGLAMLELNLEMNPNSRSVQRAYVFGSLQYALMEQGIEAGIARYHELKSELHPETFTERLLNALGFRLLRMQQNELAIAVFKLNVEQYPDGFNTYDSLGQAYMVNGDLELAIKSYEQSLQLNPENTSAVRMLERIRIQMENSR